MSRKRVRTTSNASALIVIESFRRSACWRGDRQASYISFLADDQSQFLNGFADSRMNSVLRSAVPNWHPGAIDSISASMVRAFALGAEATGTVWSDSTALAMLWARPLERPMV
jgi:hypothetical protein